MTRRILIVGSWGTVHIRRFLSVLCRTKDDNLVIDSFDLRFDDIQPNECGVNDVFRVKASPFFRKIYRARRFGTFLFELKKLHCLRRILSANRYDLVNIHSLPINCVNYVRIVHSCRVKVMLTPLGSDVLRLKPIYNRLMRRAFDKADYVGINMVTGFYQTIKNKFCIDESKFINLGYGSETISAIISMKDKYSKNELARMIGIPSSQYYICCGYNASSAQHQFEMIEALSLVKDSLPDDYCLLFPLTYGAEKDSLFQTLSRKCKKLGLKAYFITTYLTVERVAALRLISDLFIHIQPTDAYCASLQEFLLAGSKVLNGEWLSYPSLEKNGMPYYTCSSLETLSRDLRAVLESTENERPITQEHIKEISNNSWEKRIEFWIAFYNNPMILNS